MVDTFVLGKVLILTTLSFLFAAGAAPLWIHLLFKYRLGKSLRSAKQAPIFTRLHKAKAGTPTMGGVIIWGTVILIAALFALIHAVFPDSFAGSLHFLSRGQTLLPIFSLVAAGIVGLADDLLNIWGIGKNGGGVEVQHRMVLYTIIAGVGAWWFAAKLDWDLVHIPFFGDLAIGLWYIPLFLLVIIATAFSVNQTDGLDGLAGGTLISAYAAYAIICLLQGRYDLAVFCGVVSGALLAFLWFNIYPARFFMGDTGAMSLGVTLGIVAMLTNTALILPIIGGIFVIEAITTILQLVSKKLFKKKIFLVAPIHHHFEAIGWPEPKVVMRFWVLSWIFAAIGLSVIILDMSL